MSGIAGMPAATGSGLEEDVVLCGLKRAGLDTWTALRGAGSGIIVRP